MSDIFDFNCENRKLFILFEIFFIFSLHSEIREGIIRCILATDMARHNEILTQFQEISPNFDYSNNAHINLVRGKLNSFPHKSNFRFWTV